MPRIIIITLLVFIVTMSAAAGVSWYLQANAMKKNIEEIVANFNKQAPYVTYDAIEQSGFPSEVRVSLVNPRFSGNINDFLKSFTTTVQNGQASSPFDSMMEWSENAQLDGKITVSINALSDRYAITVSGNWKNTSTMDNTTVSSFSQMQGDMSCVAQLKRSSGIFGTLWNFNELASNYRDLSHDLNLLDCNVPAYTMYEDGNNKVLAAGQASRFYIQQTVDESQRNVRVYLNVPEYYVTLDGDKILSLYLRAIDETTPVLSNLAGYGKQSLEMDASFAGPADIAAHPGDTMSFSLSKFTVNNALISHSMNMQYNNTKADDQRSAKVHFKAETTATPLYDVLLKRSARVVVHDIYTSKNPGLDKLKGIMGRYEEQGAYEVLAGAVPAVSPLGTFTQSLDGTYEGNSAGNLGVYTLSDAELSVTPYGLNLKGSANLDGGTLVPKTNMTLTCRNCIAMIDDGAAYGTRLYQTLARLDPETARPFYFTQAQVDGLKAVLLTLGTAGEADKTSLLYNISSDGTPNFLINGKNLGEVQVLVNQYIPPAAPAPASPQ